MKIKTITCHDVYNVGASLQAYALAEYLRSGNHDVAIIDYKPDYLNKHYKLWAVNNPAYDRPILRMVYLAMKLPQRLKALRSKRKREFDQFTRTMLPLTKKTYHSCAQLQSDLPEADIYFAGSDQIWNTLFPNGRDPAFYLDFVPGEKRKASYAASFATESVQAEWQEKVKAWISGLDSVSVRESSGLRILDTLGIHGGVQVMDPVFLLPAEKWKSIEKRIVDDEKYILVYDFDGNPAIGAYAKELAAKNHWKIYSVFSNDYCDRSFEEEGPLGFLNLVRSAQFVISNSFHATAFSLIFGKRFVVFNRQENINTRMRDLIEMMGISGAVIQCADDPAPEEIDYPSVQKRMNEAIEGSKEYIRSVIEGIK